MWPDTLTRSDMLLIRKAIKNRWPVPQPMKVKLVNGIRRAFNSGDIRLGLAAVTTLLAADKAQLEELDRIFTSTSRAV